MKTLDFHWEWDLPAEPAALWRWAADTDFINREAGLAPVSYAWEGAGASRRRIASSRFGPLAVRWIEHPFGWEQPVRLAVRREYLGGPARAYTSEVTLAPLPGGRTRLAHRVSVEPRNFATALVLRPILAGLAPGFERAYRQAARLASREAADEALGEPNARLLAGLVAEGTAEGLGRRLAAYVTMAPERLAGQLRPYALADAWGESREGLLDACLAGCRAGVLEGYFALRCPHCQGPKGLAPRLGDLRADAACDDCALGFAGALDRNAELLFAPARDIRAKGAIYCIAGPAATPHRGAQGLLLPGDRRLVALGSEPGAYRVWSGTRLVAEVVYDPADAHAPQVAGSLDLALAEPEALVAGGPRFVVALLNEGEGPLPYAIEAAVAEAAPCLVAQALASPAFRRTFPEAALASGASFSVETLTLAAFEGPEPGYAPRGGFLATAEDGRTVWAFFDPLDALEAAMAAAGSERAIALEVGPVTATGAHTPCPCLSGRPVEDAFGLAAGLPPGAVALAPALASDAALELELSMAGWTEQAQGPTGARAYMQASPLASEASP